MIAAALAWLPLSLTAAVLIGRGIRIADEKEGAR